MKNFKGPKHQGGWVVIGMAVAGVASSISEQKAADKKGKQDYGDERDLSTIKFEQDKWLKEQDHKWNLEDYQRTQNYKEDAIRGFADAAPANVNSADGSWGPAPARTDVSAETANLAQVDENGQPYMIDPRTGQPIFGAPVKPTGTLAGLKAA